VQRLYVSWNSKRSDCSPQTRPAPPTQLHSEPVADQLEHVIEHGEHEQAKALLPILIAELKVNSRDEILPTYRVCVPMVCAPNRAE
jgi:hypothetical protein